MTIQVFPQLSGQGFWATKTPAWNTTTKKAASGRQIRVTQQGLPIWQFKVGYEYIRERSPSQLDLSNLFAFFNGCQGALTPFYVLDPYDNAVSNQEIAVGDGQTTSFQVNRTVGATSPYPWVEPVYGLKYGFQILLNGTPVTSGWNLGNLGVLVFNSAPAAGTVISWTGQFYFLCHFTEDTLSTTQMVQGLWSNDGLSFESLIP